jgi:hypothetical protein
VHVARLLGDSAKIIQSKPALFVPTVAGHKKSPGVSRRSQGLPKHRAREWEIATYIPRPIAELGSCAELVFFMAGRSFLTKPKAEQRASKQHAGNTEDSAVRPSRADVTQTHQAQDQPQPHLISPDVVELGHRATPSLTV